MSFFPVNQNQILPNMPQSNMFHQSTPLLYLQQPQCIIIYSTPFIQGNQIDHNIQQFTNNMNTMGNHVNMYDQPQQIFLNNDLHRMHKSNELLTNSINFNYQQIGQDVAQFFHQQKGIPQQPCLDMQGIQDISNTLTSFAHLESQQSNTYDRNSFSYLQQTPTSFKTQRNASISNNINMKVIPLSNVNELESQVMQAEEILTFQNVQILETSKNSTKQEQLNFQNEIKTEQLDIQKKKNRSSQKQTMKNEVKPIKKENSYDNCDAQLKLNSNNSMSSSKSQNEKSKLLKFEQKNLISVNKTSENNSQSLVQCSYKLLSVTQNEQIQAEQDNCIENEKPLQEEINQASKSQKEKQQQLQNSSTNQELLNSNTNISEKDISLNLQQFQSEILNKISIGKACSESKIIKNFQLSEALQFMKQSIFNQKKEIIFEQKNLTPFKLRQSNLKNDEIVFAQIKESRRNNRLNKKEDDQLKCKGDGSSQDPEIISDEDDDSSINKQSSQFKQKAINGKILKVTSKFHNLKKLFMYKLIATFNMSNMMDIGVPIQVREAILKLMVKFKLSAKKSEEFNRKTEFFSQAHYNALFLHLTPKTITALSQNKFEVYLHKLIFQIDLEKISHYINNPQQQQQQQQQQLNNNNACQSTQIEIETDQFNDCFRNHSICCYEERIQYINILKRYCYQIVKNSNMFGINDQPQNRSNEDNYMCQDEQLQMQNQDKQLNEQENMRMAYTFRALQGISNLSKGLIVKKF
ncbi:hypothetical protein ABPG72_003015 [Tetrahymena utriculariae]